MMVAFLIFLYTLQARCYLPLAPDYRYGEQQLQETVKQNLVVTLCHFRQSALMVRRENR
jgi:hypothetical protein